MRFGPLGEHSLLCDEAVPSIRSTLMEHVLGTLISTSWLIVVIGDLLYTLGPIRRKEKGDINSLTVLLAFDVNPKSLIGCIKFLC